MSNFGQYDHSKSFSYNNKVVMTYNNQEKVFKYSINGQCKGEAFKILTSNTGKTYQYRIAVQIQPGDMIELTHFSKIKL